MQKVVFPYLLWRAPKIIRRQERKSREKETEKKERKKKKRERD